MVHRISEFGLIGLKKEDLRIDDLLASPYPYLQQLVKYIKHGGSVLANGPTDVLEAMEVDCCPVKIEGYERFNETMFKVAAALAKHYGHYGYVSAHLFLSPKDSLSFPMHVDLDDVVIYMVEGRKEFLTECGNFMLEEGHMLYIPRGVKHQAINHEQSVMLSFGLELFIEQKL